MTPAKRRGLFHAAGTGGRLLAIALGGAMTLAGCGDGQPAHDIEGVQLDAELGLGATGPAVAAATKYLRSFGYFPNSAIAAQFPSWAPIVSEGPAQPDRLDEHLQEALAKLQANLGLPVTGTLNASTFAAMQQPRCGVPDVDRAAAGRVDKFALYPAGNRWTKTSITFRFASTGGLGATNQPGARALISAGIKSWEANTNLTFTEVTTGGDFAITFKNIDGAGNILAFGSSPPSPGLTFDTSESWNATSVLAVAIHEAGHLIGMDHSSFGSSLLGFPVMYPVNSNVITLTDEDIIGANAMYNTWSQLPGAAIDIGVNSVTGGSGDVVWVLGTDKVPYYWNGSGWIQAPGVTGIRIAVDSQGHGLVVRTDNRIFRHQFSTPPWVELTGGGQLKDVGAGQDGSVWGIGLDNRVWVFNSSTGGWVFTGGPTDSVAIDVGPTGQPYVLTSSNQLWVFGSAWSQMASGVGFDVGVGGKTNGPGTRTWMYVFGTDGHPYLYDNQTALSFNFACDGNVCSSGAPATNTFVQVGGTATRMGVGGRGRMWLVNSSNQIFARNEMP